MKVTAFIMIIVSDGKKYFVLRRLNKIKEISDVWLVLYGDYDVICKTMVKNLNELEEIITKKIRKIPYISMTNTEILL